MNDWAEGIAQIVRAYIDDQVVQLRAENSTLRALVAETEAKIDPMAARLATLESQENLSSFVDYVARELA